jgi:hypothetical protein
VSDNFSLLSHVTIACRTQLQPNTCIIMSHPLIIFIKRDDRLHRKFIEKISISKNRLKLTQREREEREKGLV